MSSHATSGIPRHIGWSTDHVDTSDPFQRRWLLRQTLAYGVDDDIRALNLHEVERELESLDLPPPAHDLWKSYVEYRHA